MVAAGPGRPLEAPGESGSFRFGRLWIRPGGGPGRRQRNRRVSSAAWNGRGRRAVKIHREDGELALDVRPELGLLLAGAEEALVIADNGGAEQLVPPGSGHNWAI